MVVVAPAKHKLAKKKAIPLSDIADEQFIVREHGSGTRIDVLFAIGIPDPYSLGTVHNW